MGSIIKRLIDFLLSSILLVVLSPLLVLVSLWILFSTGSPILFSQTRLGEGGVPFEIFKFRTMVPGAVDLRNPDGSTFSTSDDPRVTQVGRFLRRTSLDELPQLLNIFKGEMSLVGPRPDQVDQLTYYTEEEMLKLSVRPGITGLAQISGRNQISWQQRKSLDLEYVRNQSLWLDMQILLKTIPYVLAGKGVNMDGTQVE
jgi:lipopolysaccharide/colanic/teichoic acid biosynthesis glycosyltransferase